MLVFCGLLMWRLLEFRFLVRVMSRVVVLLMMLGWCIELLCISYCVNFSFVSRWVCIFRLLLGVWLMVWV